MLLIYVMTIKIKITESFDVFQTIPEENTNDDVVEVTEAETNNENGLRLRWFYTLFIKKNNYKKIICLRTLKKN